MNNHLYLLDYKMCLCNTAELNDTTSSLALKSQPKSSSIAHGRFGARGDEEIGGIRT